MYRHKNLTQFRLLEEHAENILKQYAYQANTEIRPPIPIELIAEKMGLRFERGILNVLDGGAAGVLLEDEGIIIVNSNDGAERRRFTIAHEIGHHSLPSDFNNPSDCLHYGIDAIVHPEKRPQLQEIACNRFAGALIMPISSLRKEIGKYSIINDKTIFPLAKTFSVSVLAMLTRIEYLIRNLVQLTNLDRDSLDKLKVRLLRSRHCRQLVFNDLGAFNTDNRIISRNERSAVIQIVESKLLQLGLTKAIYRNGRVGTETVKTPLEALGKPLVIEFAGTPNSGKSTQIEILADYLQDYRGFSVSIIDEVYRYCKVDSRYDYKLYWMFATTIRNLVEITDETKSDVVILNRGLFDILAFLHLYHEQGRISKRELITHATSLTIKKLCHLEDIVIVMKTTPEVSLQREKNYPKNTIAGLAEELDQWNPNPTSTLTNEDGVAMINKCYEKTLHKYKSAFKDIYQLEDDGNKTIDAVAIEIGRYIHCALPRNRNVFQKEPLLQRRKSTEGYQLSFSGLLNSAENR